MSQNMQNDPQATMWFVMRPQEGFEQIYQGLPHSTPIPLYPYQANGALALESETLRSGYDPRLASYLQVARGSTVMMIFPRVQGLQLVSRDTYVTSVQQYTYQLRWRQRPLDDAILSKGQRRFSTSAPTNVSTYSTTRRLAIPCSQGEVITPEYPENGNIGRGIYTQAGAKLIDQQGVYDDATYDVADSTMFGSGIADLAMGPTAYPVHYTRCDGDELGVVVYRVDEGVWDFDGDGEDWPFADTYGNGVYLLEQETKTSHAINPSAGVYVCTAARATSP